MPSLKWDELLLAMAGIEYPMAILDIAGWVVDNPKATKQEVIAEGNHLIEKHQL